ncbi:hypothetical protein SMD20_39960 [Nonomuraea sp. LP-02]|nr:hypothetical protein [Nonomuraea sp. LP-02]MED7930456.1 hypothetical protein [Nonomuraea sp. LP-02]
MTSSSERFSRHTWLSRTSARTCALTRLISRSAGVVPVMAACLARAVVRA